MKKAYLVLSDGRAFEGVRIGAEGDGLGELVFTTGMTGYLETLTDPSYAGQIILQTFPLIGNYGVIPADFEGRCLARGYVVRELCAAPSNFRSEYPLDLTAVRSYAVRFGVREASCKEAYTVPAAGKERFHVALLDYGAKHHIVESLTERGCRVTVLPHDTAAEDVLALAPDGLMLSNGPGDPKENVYEIAQLKKLMGRLPVFGICLGHQLAALALGGETVKLKYGHRGANQPVKDLKTGRCFITSQNHGYAVLADRLRGPGLSRAALLHGAVSPRGQRGPARHGLSVRPLCRHDGRRVRCLRIRISGRCWSSAPAPS